ncbi:MAG: PVC-type heme-binding CxxCH protein [Pirellulales bacterium]
MLKQQWAAWLLGCLCLAGLPRVVVAEESPPLRVLFLGDNGHHQPEARFRQLQPVLAKRGIELDYTDRMADIHADTLAKYDALAIYANIEQIAPQQEQALLDYVAAGHGLVPLHCASFCFLNSPKYIALVGAQFKSHGTGTFRTENAEPDHPLMRGFSGFESWDETYVHDKHNEQDRTVLEYRVDADNREPWTWVRTHGKGRVFYTAWGHDQRTWANPGFQNLVERGILWASGRDPAAAGDFADRPRMTRKRTDVEPFEYVEANVPFYPPSAKSGGVREPIRTMQKPLSPEESAKHIVTPEGFEARLFAAEPDIGKPICMNWDESGRLWIAETVDYPNDLRPEGQGRDRIRICEDTDGDGRADKFTLFADKLSIPTSILHVHDGLIVHQAPHTLFLRDTDGDDVADQRYVLFTGWSIGDTHAGPSNLRYGLDNWIYGMVGYAGFEGEIFGQKESFRTGFYRFRIASLPTSEEPAEGEFEFLRNTNNNSWGVGISEEGILFGSTANGNPSVYMPIANRYYEAVRGWSSSVLGGIAESNRIEPITDNVRQVDWHGGFTAAAGHALYTARDYPQEYWNKAAFVCEPTGHLVATFMISPNGADFTSRNAFNLFASDDEWTAPIAAEVGPDGNVWVIDWYNYIVQHNPVPAGFENGKGNAYVTDLRDKQHGRIYRVVYLGKDGGKAKGKRPKAERAERSAVAPTITSLEGATADDLVAALGSDNMFWRLQAQRLLVEGAKTETVPRLTELANATTVDAVGLNTSVIHALNALGGLNVLQSETVSRNQVVAARAMAAGLRHPSPGVRRNAWLALPPAETDNRATIRDGLAPPEEDPQVLLAALLKAAEGSIGIERQFWAVKLMAGELSTADPWILDAATCVAARRAGAFLEKVCSRQPTNNGRAKLDRIAIIAEHFARDEQREDIDYVLRGIATAPPAISETILAGLNRGWPKDAPATLEESTEQALLAGFDKLSPAGQSQLVALTARWGNKAFEQYAAAIAATFLEQARDADKEEKDRLAAASQLIEFRKQDLDSAVELLELMTPRTSPELARGLLEAAAKSESPELGAALVERFAGITPALRGSVVRALLSRSEWTLALLDGLDSGVVPLADLALDQKQGLANHPDQQIASRAKELLARGGGLPSADRQKVLAELMPLTMQKGDATLGQQLFKKQCGKCHTHSGEGTKIGPDLTGMAVHPKAELLTQIIDPSRSVEGNYRVYSVIMADGRTLAGLLASETKTTIELFDAEGKKHALLREEIDELVASPKSLMPEGFEKQVTAADIANLLEFLTQRGKYLPLPLAKAATICSVQGMFHSQDADAERLIFPDWSPKVVEGVPFQLVDPQQGRVPNVVLLNGPQGKFPPQMPKSASLPCNSTAKAVHLLSGVSGWGHPLGREGSVSMIVRLHYTDGQAEDHELKNGIHFADYIRRVDVPESKFAFALRGQQIRYLSIIPQRREPIESIELVKGADDSAPIVMAVTVETGE